VSRRRSGHEQRRAAAAATAEAKARVDELQARIEELSTDELDERERLAAAYGARTQWRRGSCATRSARAARRATKKRRRFTDQERADRCR